MRSKGCGPVTSKRSKVGKFSIVRRHSSSREGGESAEKALSLSVVPSVSDSLKGCVFGRWLCDGYVMVMSFCKVGGPLTISGSSANGVKI